MSQQKDTYYKQQPNKGRNNNRNRGGGQPKRQANAGTARNLDPKDAGQKPQPSYVPKSATPAAQPTNGASLPVAPRPAQPPAGGHFGFTNGAPPRNLTQAVPPRVQSAPPSLTEQQQSPIFYPQKTFPNPNAGTHPPTMHAPHTAQAPSTPNMPQTQQNGSTQPPVQQSTTSLATPQGAQPPVSQPTTAPAQTHHPSQLPQSQLHPQSQPQPQSPTQPQQPPSQPASQPQAQTQPQPQPQIQQGYKSAPYYSPYYGYPPGVPQYQMQSMPMQQGSQPQTRLSNMPGYQIPPQNRHQGISHPVPQSIPHGVPMNPPLGAPQPVPITPTHGPMGAPLVGHVPSGMPTMNRPTMQYPRNPYTPATPPGRQVPPIHHTATVGHSVPIAVPPPTKQRQSRRIAIVNPLTGREVTNSPPKETAGALKPAPGEDSGHGETPAVVPDFQPRSPAKPIIIQAPPSMVRSEQQPSSPVTQPVIPLAQPETAQQVPDERSDDKEVSQNVEEKKEQEDEKAKKELQEKEQREKEEREKLEKETQERELKEKEDKEREQREKQEQLEREKAEQERQEREKQEQEERKKQAQLNEPKVESEVGSTKETVQPVESVPVSESLSDVSNEEVEKKKESKKPSRKEILKKADAGDFGAAHFDPYSSSEQRPAVVEPKQPAPLKAQPEPKEPTKTLTSEPTRELEDDWEANADADWEAKAEDELVLQKDNKDISLRPNFGSGGTFRSTLAPEDSWSPHNTSGKKMYERDFLLKFQPYCREKPTGLPPIEVILGYDDKKGGSPKGKGQGASQPGWLRGSGGAPFAQRGARGASAGRFTTSFRGQRGAAGSTRGGGRGARGGISKKSSKEEASPLEMPPSSEKMWVRPSRRQTGDPHAEVFGKIRNILNKLTGEKFAPLSKQLVDLIKEEVKDTEVLKGVINIIFQKALLEPGFCTMYAELCRVLERNCPPFETDKSEGKPQTFKRFLLNKCQEEFEQKPAEEKDNETTDPKLKAEQDLKRKDRMIGNIIFIGELYKEKMLTDKIVHDCVFRRLLGDIKNPAEEDIEALCKLMTTIGKVLDTPKAKAYMDAYFKRMKGLSENPKIPSRIRFLLADVIDLRKRGWDEKKAVDPRTARAKPAARRPAATPTNQGARNTQNDQPRGRPAAPASPGGWETVGNKSRHEPSNKNQPMVLGPNSQMGGSAMGSVGAKGWRDGPEKTQGKRTSEPGSSRNMFSALAQERSPSVERKVPDDKDEFASSKESGRSPRGPTRGGRGERPKDDFEDEPPAKSGGTTWKEVEESSRILLLEYLDSHDTEEALECFKDLGAPELHANILKMAMVQALDLKEPDRRLYATLFKALFEEGVVTEQQFEQGYKAVFDDLENLMEDAPRAPLVIGSFVGRSLLDGSLKLGPAFLQTISSLVSSSIADKLMAGTFAAIVESAGVEELRELYKNSGVNVMEYFRSSNQTEEYLSQWLAKYKLPSLSPTREYAAVLQKMINQGDDVDSIASWIEANLASDVWTDGDVPFATSLCRYLLDHIVAQTSTGSFDSEDKKIAEEKRLLVLYSPLLLKFVSNYIDTQLECLFTVQRFCFDHKFPKGLLERIFHQFYMHEVILEEVYRTWAADESHKDVPGKQQALAEVSAWLKWLDSAQKEEGDETDNRED